MRRSVVAASIAAIVAVPGTARSQPATGRDLALAEAVRLTLASDAELYIGREEARAAGDEVTRAESLFTPRLFGELFWTRDDRPPSATSFAGEQRVLGGEVGVSGVMGTGLTYTVTAGLAQQRMYDAPFSTVYTPATTTTVRAEVVQPLLRGAFSAARRPITVASLRRGQSEQELRARIERAIAEVETAYWNLVSARSEREARGAALALASEQVTESKRITKLGTGSDLDVVEAETAVSRRTLELARSERAVIEAEGKLLESMGVRAEEASMGSAGSIVPTDAATIESTLPPLEEQLQIARSKRPDVHAAHDLVTAESAQLDVTDDKRRLGLDLVVGAGTAGFGGKIASTYATAAVNGGLLDPPYTPDPAYNGGLGTSAKNLGRDFNVYVGLRVEVGNDQAKVDHAIQQRTVSRARLAEREALSRVETEVRTASARVALELEIVARSDQVVVLATKLVEGMRKRFRVGAATSFDVLRVSDELTRARIDAARARADYRIGMTRLAAATGTLLDRFGIAVGSLGVNPR
ncbi:MAG: outer membrane protein [Myxococcales bacterium]|nr:outer membrane protein [Myxococcales bacterium]